MHPRDTQYYIAFKPQHYKAAHHFMEAEGYEPGERLRLQFPTVIAVRSDKVVGLLSTAMQGNLIVASNLVLAKELKKPLIVAMRLLESYETVLRQAGVKSYLFGLEGKDTPLQEYMAEVGMQPYQVTDERSWYKRDLT